jgi:hypothetical protein
MHDANIMRSPREFKNTFMIGCIIFSSAVSAEGNLIDTGISPSIRFGLGMI